MIKKILCAALCAIMLLSTALPAALADSVWYCPKCGRQCTDNYCPSDGTPRPQGNSAGSYSSGTYTVYANQKANIRSGPASSYSKLGTVSKGTALTAVQRVASHEGGKDWYQIIYNGGTAYISVSCVTGGSGVPQGQASTTGIGVSSYGSSTGVSSSGSGTPTGGYTDYAYATCTLNSKLATRTGPGTTYDEPGTFLSSGSAVTVLSKAYDNANGIWWVQVEFYYGRNRYRAYTGLKRMSGLNINNVPEEYPIGSCTVNRSLECYYGPGYDYKQISRNVPAGVSCTIYGYAYGGSQSSDFIQIEFYDSGLKCWRRAWVPDPFVDDYWMYYGF